MSKSIPKWTKIRRKFRLEKLQVERLKIADSGFLTQEAAKSHSQGQGKHNKVKKAVT